MGQIGTLTTGAGVQTTIAGQSQCEQFILLGNIGTANPLSGLQVEIDGTTYFNVIGQATLLSAYAKWLSGFVSTLEGVLFKIATGNIPSKNTTYRFTNAGATTPAILAWSDNDAGIPFVVSTTQINASSYMDFEKFSALFVGTPGNITSVEIVFSSGRKSTLTQVEVDAYFAYKQATTEANGQLLGVTVIDNTDQSIQSVRIYCSAANTILIAKIPDVAFAALRGK